MSLLRFFNNLPDYYSIHSVTLPKNGNVTNVMLFFRSKGVATPLLRKNRKKKTLHLQHYPKNLAFYKSTENNHLAIKYFLCNTIYGVKKSMSKQPHDLVHYQKYKLLCF
jgi:hypothetical protein